MKAIISVLMLTAGAAQACPRAGDLEHGIRLSEADEVWHIYTRLDDTKVRRITAFADGTDENRMNFLHGAYPVHAAWTDDGVIDTFSVMAYYFAEQPPVPSDTTTWKSTARVLTFDDIYDETMSVTWSAADAPITIGACDYAALTGTLIAVNEYETITQEFAYLSALGIAIELSFQYDNDAPDIFAYTAIAPIKP